LLRRNIESGVGYRGFTAVGKDLADVKRFAEIVRWCERTGKIEDLGRQLVTLEEEADFQTTWGGTFHQWLS